MAHPMNRPAVPGFPSAGNLQSGGAAWRDVTMSVFSVTALEEAFDMPAASVPLIAWVVAGEALAEESDAGGALVTSHIRPGSLFLTVAGAPYTVRWKRVSPQPLEVVLVSLSAPIFAAAMQDVHGVQAPDAPFRNLSGIADAPLVVLLQCLRGELAQQEGSALYVNGIAHAIAVHLARHYVDIGAAAKPDDSALPAHKLRLATSWMRANLAEPFSLATLASIAGTSEFHFDRLFKKATGMPPAQYHVKLRMETAQRLLRETTASIVAIANDVGYANPSYFAQLFRKETGMTPSGYRHQR